MTRLSLLVQGLYIYFRVKLWEKATLKKGSQWIEKINGAEIEVLLTDWTW